MDPLLEPISAAAPCGVDLSYEPVYNELAVMIQGTPENQFEANSAKEPAWPAIRKLTEDNLKLSKDLQIAVYWTTALSQTGGIVGAARGMEVIAGITRVYWDALFPNLDPDDKDPTQRVNILSQLTVVPGGYGDPIRFISRLNAARIFNAPGLGPISIELLTKDAALGARLSEIAASSDRAEVTAGIAALQSVLASVHALDDFLIATVTRANAPSFDPLIKALDRGVRLFEGLVASAVPEGQGAAAPGTAAGAPAAPPVKKGISGEIQNLDDVRKIISMVCEYYAAHEPSSPVPLLLQRANKLIGMNFLALIENLNTPGKTPLETTFGPNK